MQQNEGRDPFTLIPDLMWERVMSNQNAKDKLSLLRSSKIFQEKFDGLFNKLMLAKLIAEVPAFSNLLIEENAMMNLRRVSRHLRPIATCQLEAQHRLQPWHFLCNIHPSSIKEWSSSVVPLYTPSTGSHPTREEDRVDLCQPMDGDVILQTAEDVLEFTAKVSSWPLNCKPFPARSMYLYIIDSYLSDKEKIQLKNKYKKPKDYEKQSLEFMADRFEKLIDATVELFEKFGGEILSLTVHCLSLRYAESMDSISFLLASILERMPHCVSFTYVGEDREIGETPPPFGNADVEEFALLGFTNPFLRQVFVHNGHKLRKLVLDLNVFHVDTLEPISHGVFEKLQELVVLACQVHTPPGTLGFDRFRLFTGKCKFPVLRKLTMLWNRKEIESVFRVIVNLPALKYLDLQEATQLQGSYLYDGKASKFSKKFPDLEFLSMPLSPLLTYGFMKEFPSMKEINFATEGVWWNRRNEPEYNHIIGDFAFCNTLPAMLQLIVAGRNGESSLWDILPYLKLVSLDWAGKVANLLRYERSN